MTTRHILQGHERNDKIVREELYYPV